MARPLAQTAGVFLFVALSSFSACAEDFAFYVHRGAVWRVHADGRAARLPFDFGSRASGHIDFGTTGPLPSPDKQWIAFTRENDVWLLEVESEETTRLTEVGRPYDETYASVFVYITTWSADRSKLLYYVDHGMTHRVDDPRPDYKVRPADYGFFIYNLENNTRRPIELPGQFAAWLPDGDFLLTSHTRRPVDKQLLRFDPNEGVTKLVTDRRGWYGQFDLSPDGQRLLAHLSAAKGSPLWTIELATGAMDPLTAAGPSVRYQWPRFSPSGRRIAYERRDGMEDGVPRESVVVDARAVYACPNRVDFRWINDERLLIACEGELLVLDAKTRDVQGRHALH